MLTVDAVSVHYGHVQAVREASLAVAPGELVTVVGSNGAGKSSLLNAIAGLRPASAGTITWNGTPLAGLPAHRVVRAGVALVPEGRQMLNTMAVADNLLLGHYRHQHGIRALLGPIGAVMRSPAVQERLSYVYELFPRLQERQGQPAGSLSGGEQQMLAIGRALMSSPRLLLLDEPSIGLAPNLVREILSRLQHLRDGGLTILLVEQDAHAALRIADRGYVMETGRIVAEGTASELLNSARMRRAYLGAS
jgi:branched-chain amino acid transport system ATP-binding protein